MIDHGWDSHTDIQMKAEYPLNVAFFQKEAGNEPVLERLKELSKEECFAYLWLAKKIGLRMLRAGLCEDYGTKNPDS